MHRMCMVDGSTFGLFSFGSIVGFLYIIVSAGMCAITCVFRKGSMYGMWFWYYLFSRMVNIVIVLGSFFGASLAHYMAILAFFSLWEWAYPIHF